MPFLLTAYERALEKSETVIVAGIDLPGGAELAASLRAGLKPGRVVAGFASRDQAEFAAVVPAAAAMTLGAKALAYRCEGGACGLPVETL
ncbi:MAG: hypothetical protein M0D55_09255 [Elusimicrobiota bacterium]|nr:MAG: hypothetical protein M0D55_09255 [Elusimicrobiota bacterium]